MNVSIESIEVCARIGWIEDIKKAWFNVGRRCPEIMIEYDQTQNTAFHFPLMLKNPSTSLVKNMPSELVSFLIPPTSCLMSSWV